MNKTLEDLAVINYGKDYKANPVGDEVPIYGTGGIMGYTSMKLNTGPAILSGRKGSINNPLFIDGDFWNVDTIFCIKPKEGIDPKWLFYNFRNTDLSKLNEATGVPSVSASNLYKLKFNYFGVPQQKKIAQILSTCDTVLEQTEAAISKYQALKQGMLHDLFTRGIDVNTGHLRQSYKDAPELYKKTELGFVPREWEVEKISKNSSLVTNGFVGVATPFYTDKENGIKYLFGTNVRADRLDFRDLRFVTKEFHQSKLKSNLKAGDMLTVQSGHIGTSAVIPEDFGEANCHALIITRFSLDIVNSNYISYYLNSALGIKGLEKLFIGSTIKHINTSDLAKHPVPLPNITEQHTVVDKLKKIDKKIHTEQQTLAKYSQLKAGLMQDLLSGAVGVERLLNKTEN